MNEHGAWSRLWAAALVCAAACGIEQPAFVDPVTGGIPPGEGPGSGTVGGSAGEGTAGNADAAGTTVATDGSVVDDDSDDAPLPAFDVGAGDAVYCQYKDPGIYCRGNVAVECSDAHAIVAEQSCVPAVCAAGSGCVECAAGQTTCMGPYVMECNDAASPATWQIRETCDAATRRGCDVVQGACVYLNVVGGIEPTGVYYQYALFETGGVFRGGYDVDSHDNRIYVNGGGSIDVYEVELLDSDGDGVAEPNQHPDNEDALGPTEARVLTYLETIAWPTVIAQAVSEIYANDLGLWVGGQSIQAMPFGAGSTEVVTAPPQWAESFSHLGFDDVHGVWYASNERDRRVFQHHAETDAWGLAFYFPSLAGDHMDGLEVVTQPDTGIPYVYVSDMTSDFIAQYRLDPNLGWVQENLFSYDGTTGSLVEGLGYGAFNHFWATGGQYLYEVGGGDLAQYTEPPG